MDAPRTTSWRELTTTYSLGRDYWRARVRAMKQPRVTVIDSNSRYGDTHRRGWDIEFPVSNWYRIWYVRPWCRVLTVREIARAAKNENNQSAVLSSSTAAQVQKLTNRVHDCAVLLWCCWALNIDDFHSWPDRKSLLFTYQKEKHGS